VAADPARGVPHRSRDWRFGAAGYSRNNAMERRVRDARMFTIGGGTAQILRTVIASRLLDRKLPQTRDGYLNLPHAQS
jgi:hypothetical protein